MALGALVQRLRVNGGSAQVAIVLLLVANLIPLVGVLALGWDVFTLLILYWIENGVVGLFNVPKIVLAAAPTTSSADKPPIVLGTSGKVSLACFFLLHYGLFWIVHGTFVTLLASTVRNPGTDPSDMFSPLRAVLGEEAVVLGAIALLISHGASFVFNFVGRREYLRVSPSQQMYRPYPRMVVLHLTVIAGGFVVLQLGQPVLLMVLMVALKTALDLVLYLREHSHRQSMPDAAWAVQPGSAAGDGRPG